MKKWNTPEIAALDLNATESGLFCTDYECWPFINDNLKKCDQTENPSNVTPTEEDPVDPVSELS